MLWGRAEQILRQPESSDGAATMQSIDNVNPTIHLAIELSASSWLIAARVPGSEKPHLHRIDGGNTAALLALISSLRAHVARRLDAAISFICCLEAGRDGFCPPRLFTAHGIAKLCPRPPHHPHQPPCPTSQDGPARCDRDVARARGLSPG